MTNGTSGIRASIQSSLTGLPCVEGYVTPGLGVLGYSHDVPSGLTESQSQGNAVDSKRPNSRDEGLQPLVAALCAANARVSTR